MGCVSTLRSECRRRGKNERKLNTRGLDVLRLTMPPAKPTERREGDEAHVHTDRANAGPIRSGAHSRGPSDGSAAQRGLSGTHIFRQQRWTYYPGTGRERSGRGAVGKGGG